MLNNKVKHRQRQMKGITYTPTCEIVRNQLYGFLVKSVVLNVGNSYENIGR